MSFRNEMFKCQIFHVLAEIFIAENSELFSKYKFRGRLKDVGN